MVTSTPVFPRGRLGNSDVFGAASWARKPVAVPNAEAVASEPAWRNVRRSVRRDSFWAIVLDSSFGGLRTLHVVAIDFTGAGVTTTFSSGETGDKSWRPVSSREGKTKAEAFPNGLRVGEDPSRASSAGD